MNKKDLDYFRKALTDQLQQLIKDAQRFVSNGEEIEMNSIEMTERASFETEVNLKFRIRDRESFLVKKIEAALDRIDDGSFGICDVCEEPIARKRLEARPVTTKCIQCKIDEEAVERVAGF